jgi:hypothetical protein
MYEAMLNVLRWNCVKVSGNAQRNSGVKCVNVTGNFQRNCGVNVSGIALRNCGVIVLRFQVLLNVTALQLC